MWVFDQEWGSADAHVIKAGGGVSRSDEPAGEGRPDEAAALIAEAEAVAELAGLARRHKLDMLGFLLGMTQLEAEEHLRRRSKRTLS